MSTPSTTSWLKPFLSGIIATIAATQLRRLLLLQFTPRKRSSISQQQQQKQLDHNDNNNDNDDDCTSFSSSSTQKSSNQQTSNNSNNNNTNESQPTTTTTNPTTPLMDSPKLDQRILRKAEAALLNRTSRLIIVVERCTNDHNYSAILRTAEALGVQHVYIIAPQCINKTLKQAVEDGTEEEEDDGMATATTEGGDDAGEEEEEEEDTATHTQQQLYRSTGQRVRHATTSEINDRAQHHLFAQRALEWLDVTEFDTTKECIDRLKSDGYHIWSTDLSQEAVCLTPEGLGGGGDGTTTTSTSSLIPNKLAIVFGTEAVGCTTEILTASDRRVYLPLRGYADSLNLSVATALVVHQLFTLDPTLVGGMDDAERLDIRRRWYGKLAGQRLLSRSEKAGRRRLMGKVKTVQRLEARLELYNAEQHEAATRTNTSTTTTTTTAPLTKEQLTKIDTLPTLQSQLDELNTRLANDAARAVEGLVLNPPEPLGDMRRADEHRATFAGKKTKERHGEAWADMPATGYYRTDLEGSVDGSAAFFRGRLRDVDATGESVGGVV